MGFVKSLFEGPPDAVQAHIDRPVTQGQTDQAYQNSQQALAQQQAFLQAAQGQNGLGNQSQVFNQLGNVVNGTGFNPAQAQLANSTGANVANQAALMAGQRGANANAGLIARQAGMQGANIQQQAAGQGAALQAQQSLGALGQQGAIAGQQVGNQLAGQQLYGQTALGQQQNLLGGVANANNSAVASAGQQNQVNQANYASNMNLVGGLASGIATGGMSLLSKAAAPAAGAASIGYNQAAASSGDLMNNAMMNAPQGKAHGGIIHGPSSKAGRFMKAMPAPEADVSTKLKSGGPVPGKAPVKGDNKKNDVVHAMLSPGEIVIPRSITQGDDAPAKAAQFVAAIMARNGHMKAK